MLHELLFPELKEKKWAEVNLNKESIDWPDKPIGWVNDLHKQKEIDHSYGGYMEDRSNLRRYQKLSDKYHIGIDFQVSPFTRVLLPFDGTLILKEVDQDQDGGWGSRAIYLSNGIYWCFAHLCHVNGALGKSHKAGTNLGMVGNHDQNGGWFPHLHVHCMIHYEPWTDAYQSKKDTTRYPNPEEMINVKRSLPILPIVQSKAS